MSWIIYVSQVGNIQPLFGEGHRILQQKKVNLSTLKKKFIDIFFFWNFPLFTPIFMATN